MKFLIGTVTSNIDVTRKGLLKVAFMLQDNGVTQDEWVRYVSPYGNNKAAFVAIPEAGSTVLCAYADSVGGATNNMRGYFYMGSLMGITPLANRLLDPKNKGSKDTKTYTDTEQSQAGIYGPDGGEDEYAAIEDKDSTGQPQKRVFPAAFDDLYDAKGFTPEIVGLANWRADAQLIKGRSRSDDSELPFQDYQSEIKSGSGKRISCVDSPIVDGIVMTNEHKEKDYFIFSTGNSKESPFAEGEFHTRTHGPINTYTLESNIHTWVEDGRNIEIENRAAGQYSPTGETNGSRTTHEQEGSPPSRIDDIGNEDYGCVKVWSHHNNIAVSALESNSVIHVHAPGENTKVIVRTGGTVDIVAEKKITLTSDTEVELNAPMVQLNGSTEVEVNAPLVDVNASDRIEEHAANDIQLNAGKVVDVDGGSEIDMDSAKINLN